MINISESWSCRLCLKNWIISEMNVGSLDYSFEGSIDCCVICVDGDLMEKRVSYSFRYREGCHSDFTPHI